MMNLLYCINSGAFEGVLLSLLSLTFHASAPVQVYVLTMDLQAVCPAYTPVTAKQIAFLDEMLKARLPGSAVRLLDGTAAFKAELGDSKNLFSAYTPYTLLRLLADRFPLPDELLYLDADTLFAGDVYTFNAYRPVDVEYAAARDYLGKTFISGDYSNAGVLYLNLCEIRKTGLFARTRSRCKQTQMPFPDQDALNALTTAKRQLPDRFNEQHRLHSDTVVRHFAKTIVFLPYFQIINVKPWQPEQVRQVFRTNAFDAVFDEYYKIRAEITGTLLPPRVVTSLPSRWKRLRRDLSEVVSYARSNGGIFRKCDKH